MDIFPLIAPDPSIILVDNDLNWKDIPIRVEDSKFIFFLIFILFSIYFLS